MTSFAVVVSLAALVPSSAAGASHATAAEIALGEGMWALAEGDGERAVERFRAAADSAPGDGAPRYWLGLALLRLGRGREGLAAVEAALAARRPARIEPRSALAAAAAEVAAGDPVAAADTLEAALVATPTPIDRRPLWDGTVSATAGWDANPHLLSEEIALPLPGDPPGRLVRGSEADRVGELGLRVGLYPRYRPDGWCVGLALEPGQSFHQEFGELDLGRARVSVHLARGADPQGTLAGPLGSTRVPLGGDRASLLLQAGAGRYWLGGTSYLDTWEGAVVGTLRETATTATVLELAYADRRYSGRELSDPRRNGHDATLRLGQRFLLGGARGRGGGRPALRLSALVADLASGREFTARAAEGRAELELPVGGRWTASLDLAVRRDAFEHPESNLFEPTGPPRRDTTRRAAAALSFRAAARLLWTARLNWADRDSNADLGPALPDLDYRRTSAGLGASWTF